MSTSGFPGLTQTIDHEALFERLAEGHTLVTGNTRLSRVLTNRFSQWRMRRGEHQWPSPAITPYSAWLTSLWDSACLLKATNDFRPVLSNRQANLLWEQVVGSDPSLAGLLRPQDLAAKLRETRSTAKEWKLNFQHSLWDGESNENHAAFIRCNNAFERFCDQDGWMAPEDRPSRLRQAIFQNPDIIDGPVDLVGFDEFTPSQQDLLAAISDSGIAVRVLSLEPASRRVALWRAGDEQSELRQMARWVRDRHENDPAATIGVVVPDLHLRRAVIDRHLQDILAPGHDPVRQGPPPWNISMGSSLIREPLIQTAFDLLALMQTRMDIQAVGRVLRAPWLQGGISERNGRSLLEKCLRDHHPRQLQLGEVLYRSTELRKFDRKLGELSQDQWEPQPWNCPKFSAVLKRLGSFRNDNGHDRRPSFWAEKLDQLLVGLGWPLKGKAKNIEHTDRNWQALRAWRECLLELSSLDNVAASMTRQSAIRQLRAICRDTVFQPYSPPASIQILGLFEASGLRFDHLWVVGLYNDNWPPSSSPDPFIPLILQREAGMPHSSPQRELAVAHTSTERLLESAPDIVFSYPGMVEGEPVLASPLLMRADILPTERVAGWDEPCWQTRVFESRSLEQVPIKTPGQLIGEAARGGSSILKHQALCPFRAFASHRLEAEGLESPADGISPSLHGSLVHRVLENLWQEIRSQQRLLEFGPEQLSERVRTEVEKVVSEEIFLKRRPVFAEVESARLHRLILASLEQEKRRNPFEVMAFEREITPVIEGQEIRLVIDRIDRTQSGDEIIIDYKTGTVDPKRWFSDRPEDPQLPLYAISSSQTPAAVVFAVIRDDGCLYKGVVQQPGTFPDLPPQRRSSTAELIDAGENMAATIINWRSVLHRLMADFLAGRAAIDPKDGRKTCRGSYCKLQPLCRIDELESLKVKEENRTARSEES